MRKRKKVGKEFTPPTEKGIPEQYTKQKWILPNQILVKHLK